MIRIESLHIQEFRGIRNLKMTLGQKPFSICGPNGSGKSGVIDAIEFALTGKVSRLSGQGTKELSVSEHGPHVDMVKFPDVAQVSLNLFLPQLNKSATITRMVSAAKKPKITPNDPDIVALLSEVEEHPEITLARRDILRFILVEPTKRSEEIQAILNLEEIGQTRSALKTASNKAVREAKQAAAQVSSARDALQRQLGLSSFTVADVLAAVNSKRKILELPALEELKKDTKIDDGVKGAENTATFNKAAALQSVQALSKTLDALDGATREHIEAILTEISKLEADVQLLQAFQRRSLVEQGLELIDGPECPLCDHTWPDELHLVQHLKGKIDKSKDAEAIQKKIQDAASALSVHLVPLLDVLREIVKIAKAENLSELEESFLGWGKNLSELSRKLESVDQVLPLKERFQNDWSEQPNDIESKLRDLRVHLEGKPDPSAKIEAQTVLTSGQVRLDDYRKAQRNNETIKQAQSLATKAYDLYCEIMEKELEALYNDVQADFSSYYSQINADDEGAFTAKLAPSEGRLDFNVNFYGRGLFPPGAYHSEGHQDGMGVCLYLALMKRLLGANFTLALLDDVVMSVDAGHRREFCELLKTQFPNTQFVIATHDKLWAEQMKTTKLVTSKTSLMFRSWSVETGPVVESNLEIWNEVERDIEQGRIETAAHSLRRHLEFVSSQLAQGLGARPVFRADGAYDLGNLLPPVLGRMKELLGKAAAAAQSWGNQEAKSTASERKQLLSRANSAKGDEEWLMNKAVHFNEWANLERADFEPVVAAFKQLFEALQCDACHSWLYASPAGKPEALRCQCGKLNLSLNEKMK